MGFEPTISADERPQTYALDRAATGTGIRAIWFRKTTTNRHILAHVNIYFTDDRSTKLDIYISELILDSYEHMPLAYVKCIARFDLH